MGAGPLTPVLALAGIGSKLIGGAQAAPAGGGGAPAPVNPFTAGLVGQAPPPPMPERNPMFSDPVSDASGKAILDESPLAKKAIQSMFDAEDRRGAEPAEPIDNPPSMFARTPDALRSFDSKNFTRETVQGAPAGGAAAPSAPKGAAATGADKAAARVRIDLSQPAPVAKSQDRVAPISAATDTAAPARPQTTAPGAPPPAGNPYAPPAVQPVPAPQAMRPTPAPPGNEPPGMPSAFDGTAARAPGAPPTSPPVAGGMPGGSSPNMFGLNDGLSGLNKWMKGVPTNPLAQTGLALLASGYDGSNPYTSIQSGLGGIPRMELALQSGQIAQQAAARAERAGKREEAEDAQKKALEALLMQVAGEYSKPEKEGTSRVARGAAKVIR